jgi:hypothetical protein
MQLVAVAALLAFPPSCGPDVESPAPVVATCRDASDYDPCGEHGVCAGGTCVDRAACDAQETKCQTPTIAAGWCGTWQWPASDVLYCRTCEETVCLGTPGCSIVGDVCQGGDGTAGCPAGCCPVCY